MKILITGGAGYVGSLLVPELLKVDHQVVVLDWFLYKPDLFLDRQNKNLTLIKGDIRDNKTVATALNNVDVVIHLAAMSNDPSSELNPQITKEINFIGTTELATMAKKLGVKRFIYASSASVYGLQSSPATEKNIPQPLTIYSQTKLDSENFLLGLNDHNFSVTCVRPATLSGYAPRMRLDLVVNNMTAYAYVNKSIKVNGGEQYRPNLSVKDMVSVYKLLVSSDDKKISGQIFNVSQSNLKITDIAEAIKDIIDLDTEPEYFPSNDKRSYWLNSEKIKNELGFAPQFSLEDSIRDIVNALESKKFDPTDVTCRNVETLKNYDLEKIIEPNILS